MTRLDPEELDRLVGLAFRAQAEATYGADGGSAFDRVLSAVRRVYLHIDIDECRGRITFYATVDDEPAGGSGIEVVHESDLQPFASDGMTIEVLRDGTLRRHGSDDLTDRARIVGYLYEDRTELFFAGSDQENQIPRLIEGMPSLFSVPHYIELDEALDDYRRRQARTSKCRTLSNSWVEGHDGPRLFVCADNPEAQMRRSLSDFLEHVLRDAEVRPEYVVDETHPVDIRVNFTPPRNALIEIKWLGVALNEANGSITTRYGASRARNGAKQLADYLDRHHEEHPEARTIGYLFVFDVRRRRLSPNRPIDRHEAMFYADKEIPYDPEYHKLREDFRPPIRAFVEPSAITYAS